MTDLTDALRLRRHDVVALVGGGGKTTAMYRLCREAAARGRRAVASGTARFTPPASGKQPRLLSGEDEPDLVQSVRAALETEAWVIAAAGRGSKHRLQPLSYAAVESVAGFPEVDLLALEADGSAMRSFKAPAEHEPAVPPNATLVIAVVGADIFGRPLNADTVHRPERVMELGGAGHDSLVVPETVARVLAHPQGGRKGIPPGARYAVLINKVSDARLPAARETARLLVDRGVPLVVLAQARRDPPVVEVFEGGKGASAP